MRDYALSLLTEELAEEHEYVKVVREAMLRILPMSEAKVPASSLIREFISGGTYHKLY